MRKIILLGAMLLVGACANRATMRGAVVAQVQPDEVRVHVTQGTAAAGEEVALLTRVCEHHRSRAGNVSCHTEVAARGEVVQTSGNDSLVRLDRAVTAHEGDELVDHVTR